MKKLIGFLIFLFALPAFAQSTPPSPVTITVSAKAIGSFSQGQEIAATDAVGMLGLTTNFSIRSDNIITADGQSFLNGVQYVIPPLGKAIAKTNLPNKFQVYVTGGIGVTRNQTSQAVAGTAGGGINYDPSATGHFSVNLIEGRWVSQLPGSTRLGSGVVISSGLSLTF